jgi:hypothetical protein
MMKKIGLLILICIQSMLYVHALPDPIQEIDEKPVKHMLSFVPSYAFISGLRLDYDAKIVHKHWLQFAATFYARNESTLNSMDVDVDQNLIGAGFHLYHRYYPREGKVVPGLYISYGGVYQMFRATYHQEINEYYTNLQRIGGDVIIGFNGRFFNPLLIDFYTGLGLRYAILESDATRPKRFNDGMVDYGYAGSILLIGMRVSLPL